MGRGKSPENNKNQDVKLEAQSLRPFLEALDAIIKAVTAHPYDFIEKGRIPDLDLLIDSIKIIFSDKSFQYATFENTEALIQALHSSPKGPIKNMAKSHPMFTAKMISGKAFADIKQASKSVEGLRAKALDSGLLHNLLAAFLNMCALLSKEGAVDFLKDDSVVSTVETQRKGKKSFSDINPKEIMAPLATGNVTAFLSTLYSTINNLMLVTPELSDLLKSENPRENMLAVFQGLSLLMAAIIANINVYFAIEAFTDANANEASSSTTPVQKLQEREAKLAALIENFDMVDVLKNLHIGKEGTEAFLQLIAGPAMKYMKMAQREFNQNVEYMRSITAVFEQHHLTLSGILSRNADQISESMTHMFGQAPTEEQRALFSKKTYVMTSVSLNAGLPARIFVKHFASDFFDKDAMADKTKFMKYDDILAAFKNLSAYLEKDYAKEYAPYYVSNAYIKRNLWALCREKYEVMLGKLVADRVAGMKFKDTMSAREKLVKYQDLMRIIDVYRPEIMAVGRAFGLSEEYMSQDFKQKIEDKIKAQNINKAEMDAEREAASDSPSTPKAAARSKKSPAPKKSPQAAEVSGHLATPSSAQKLSPAYVNVWAWAHIYVDETFSTDFLKSADVDIDQFLAGVRTEVSNLVTLICTAMDDKQAVEQRVKKIYTTKINSVVDSFISNQISLLRTDVNTWKKDIQRIKNEIDQKLRGLSIPQSYIDAKFNELLSNHVIAELQAFDGSDVPESFFTAVRGLGLDINFERLHREGALYSSDVQQNPAAAQVKSSDEKVIEFIYLAIEPPVQGKHPIGLKSSVGKLLREANGTSLEEVARLKGLVDTMQSRYGELFTQALNSIIEDEVKVYFRDKKFEGAVRKDLNADFADKLIGNMLSNDATSLVSSLEDTARGTSQIVGDEIAALRGVSPSPYDALLPRLVEVLQPLGFDMGKVELALKSKYRAHIEELIRHKMDGLFKVIDKNFDGEKACDYMKRCLDEPNNDISLSIQAAGLDAEIVKREIVLECIAVRLIKLGSSNLDEHILLMQAVADKLLGAGHSVKDALSVHLKKSMTHEFSVQAERLQIHLQAASKGFEKHTQYMRYRYDVQETFKRYAGFAKGLGIPCDALYAIFESAVSKHVRSPVTTLEMVRSIFAYDDIEFTIDLNLVEVVMKGAVGENDVVQGEVEASAAQVAVVPAVEKTGFEGTQHESYAKDLALAKKHLLVFAKSISADQTNTNTYCDKESFAAVHKKHITNYTAISAVIDSGNMVTSEDLRSNQVQLAENESKVKSSGQKYKAKMEEKSALEKVFADLNEKRAAKIKYEGELHAHNLLKAPVEKHLNSALRWKFVRRFFGVLVFFGTGILPGLFMMPYFYYSAKKREVENASLFWHCFERMATLGFLYNTTVLAQRKLLKNIQPPAPLKESLKTIDEYDADIKSAAEKLHVIKSDVAILGAAFDAADMALTLAREAVENATQAVVINNTILQLRQEVVDMNEAYSKSIQNLVISFATKMGVSSSKSVTHGKNTASSAVSAVLSFGRKPARVEMSSVQLPVPPLSRKPDSADSATSRETAAHSTTGSPGSSPQDGNSLLANVQPAKKKFGFFK